MTAAEIQFNYRQAVNQAEKLDQVAKKLDQLSTSKMESTLSSLKNAWQSDNSPQYYAKVSSVQKDIKVTAGNVRQIANSIRSTAEAVRRAELAALEIARARVYR